MWNSRRRIAYFPQASSSTFFFHVEEEQATRGGRRLLVFAGDWFEGERVSRTLRGRHGLLLVLLLFLSAKKLAKTWPIPGEVRESAFLAETVFHWKLSFRGRTWRIDLSQVSISFSFSFLSTWMRKGGRRGDGGAGMQERGGGESRGIRILRGKNRRSGYSRSARGGKDGK